MIRRPEGQTDTCELQPMFTRPSNSSKLIGLTNQLLKIDWSQHDQFKYVGLQMLFCVTNQLE